MPGRVQVETPLDALVILRAQNLLALRWRRRRSYTGAFPDLGFAAWLQVSSHRAVKSPEPIRRKRIFNAPPLTRQRLQWQSFVDAEKVPNRRTEAAQFGGFSVT